MTESRWLDPEATAQYISVRVDQLPRLRRAGKIPAPSYHFGPRSPRYDKTALDALFEGGSAAPDIDRATEEAVNAILAGKYTHRKKASRGRNC